MELEGSKFSVFISHLRNYFSLSTYIYGNWGLFYELIVYRKDIYIYIYREREREIYILFANKFVWHKTIAQFENACSKSQIELLGHAVKFQYVVLMPFL